MSKNNRKKILFTDKTAGSLSILWRIGGGAQRFLRNFDYVHNVASWDDVYRILGATPNSIDFSDVQLWGHGYYGEPCIDNEGPNLTVLQAAIRGHLTWDSNVWFRSCSVFAGHKGQVFARRVADMLTCHVTGHTRVVSWPIPVCQSGGYTIRAGEFPHWGVTDGISDEGRSLGSYPGAGNTCSIFAMKPPKSWAQPLPDGE